MPPCHARMRQRCFQEGTIVVSQWNGEVVVQKKLWQQLLALRRDGKCTGSQGQQRLNSIYMHRKMGRASAALIQHSAAALTPRGRARLKLRDASSAHWGDSSHIYTQSPTGGHRDGYLQASHICPTGFQMAVHHCELQQQGRHRPALHAASAGPTCISWLETYTCCRLQQQGAHKLHCKLQQPDPDMPPPPPPPPPAAPGRTSRRGRRSIRRSSTSTM